MSSLDQELEALRRTPRSPVDMDWLTSGPRYQVTDENNPRNTLNQLRETSAFNRSSVCADPRLLRETESREAQYISRVVLAALHSGFQGFALRKRLIDELGSGIIAKHAELIKSILAADEGKAGVYMLDPFGCWPSCGDVVNDVNSANPFAHMLKYVKASDACSGCLFRQGSRCSACHRDLIASGQDLPKGSYNEFVRYLTGSFLPDRLRQASAAIEAVDGLTEIERITHLAQALVTGKENAVKDDQPELALTGESKLPVDIACDSPKSAADHLVELGASVMQQELFGGTPPRLLDVDERTTSKVDEFFDEENDLNVEVDPQRKVDGISVVLDDESDITL